jgi:hypothetical protein
MQRCLLWVKTRRPHSEHFSAAVPQKADVVLHRGGSFVPEADIKPAVRPVAHREFAHTAAPWRAIVLNIENMGLSPKELA